MKKFFTQFALLSTLSFASHSLLAEQVTIFAAASLTNVLQDIGNEYTKQGIEDNLTFSFAGSSTLAKQIEQEAPADIFISADQKWMDYIAEKQPTKTSNIKVLAENALVLIAPQESKLVSHTNITQIDFEQAIGNSYLAIGDDNVPVGRYAQKALKHLGLWKIVENRLSKGKDVRAVLAYIERGELPLGIVYSTDAKISNKVKVIAEFPKESYGSIVYPAATLSSKPEAKRFLDFLSSPVALSLFEKAGFKIKNSPN